MSDLIRREDVLEALLGWGTDPTDGEIEYTVNSIPTVEPKVGKWKIEIEGNGWNEWYVFTCPSCGARIKDNMGYHEWKFNYCPNCGIKMERSE